MKDLQRHDISFDIKTSQRATHQFWLKAQLVNANSTSDEYTHRVALNSARSHMYWLIRDDIKLMNKHYCE